MGNTQLPFYQRFSFVNPSQQHAAEVERPDPVVDFLEAATLPALALAAACGRQPDGPAPDSASQAAVTTGSVRIEFRIDPNPPRPGDNTYEMTVRQPDGTPVADATVTAVFSMPAMPSMNMPAMRSDASLTHVGNGTYRPSGQLSMAARGLSWCRCHGALSRSAPRGSASSPSRGQRRVVFTQTGSR